MDKLTAVALDSTLQFQLNKYIPGSVVVDAVDVVVSRVGNELVSDVM